jgi:hypothetical protein
MVNWYCRINGEELGPMTQEELVGMARTGRLRPDDLVRNTSKQNAKWYQATKVKGLEFETAAAVAGGVSTSQTAERGAAAEGGVKKGSETSIEAARVLKSLSNRKTGRSGSSHATATHDGDDDETPVDWNSRWPIIKRVTQISAVVLAVGVVLFAPHKAPEGRFAPGRNTSFVLSPPQMTYLSDGNKKVEMLPFDFTRLAIELAVILVLASGVLLYFKSKVSRDAAQAPVPSRR